MSFILGMDTGGTYTDGVIVDSSRRKIICKAKALTTKEDLTKGLKNCLEALEFDRWEEITLVSLSTTLATNAIVEGRGAKTGLIYLGMDPEEEIPADRIEKVKGRFDIMGRLQEELEAAEIERLLLDWKGTIEALAVSGYARNQSSGRKDSGYSRCLCSSADLSPGFSSQDSDCCAQCKADPYRRAADSLCKGGAAEQKCSCAHYDR